MPEGKGKNGGEGGEGDLATVETKTKTKAV